MTKRVVLSLAIVALLLSACGPSEVDIQATVTQAVGEAVNTVNAQYTQIALLTPSATNTVPPTSTPAVTSTPAGTPSTSLGAGAAGDCDVMAFIADVTVSDGEEIAAGTPFTKTWQVKNGGSCTWTTTYTIIFSSGDQMGGASSQALAISVAPGSTAEISVFLVAPATAGSYTGWWALANTSGQGFGYFSVVIEVP
ncbi:MAG: NBR1-Ig-like domain-containing protein [Anaerolineales bacterium]